MDCVKDPLSFMNDSQTPSLKLPARTVGFPSNTCVKFYSFIDSKHFILLQEPNNSWELL